MARIKNDNGGIVYQIVELFSDFFSLLIDFRCRLFNAVHHIKDYFHSVLSTETLIIFTKVIEVRFRFVYPVIPILLLLGMFG
jgi:hypothetical protein